MTGDQYTSVALDRRSKLVLSYRIGKRNGTNAYHFITDLASRVHGRIQLTTDGFVPYVGAVEDVFGADIDFAQFVKFTLATKLTENGIRLPSALERSQKSSLVMPTRR